MEMRSSLIAKPGRRHERNLGGVIRRHVQGISIQAVDLDDVQPKFVLGLCRLAFADRRTTYRGTLFDREFGARHTRVGGRLINR